MSLLSAILLLQAAAAPTAPTATAEAPLGRDTRGRPVSTVTIDGKGPFPMVVDTAAQTSLMAASLAQELGLKPLAGGIQVQGATGAGRTRLYPVDRMTSPLFDARRVAMPELTNSGVTSARGIIGMERFTGAKLLIDRSTNRIAISPSGPAPAGFATITGQRTGEGFVTVPMTLNGVQVPALIDTGAAVTIANAAAFRQLGWADGDPRLSDGGAIRGASAGGQAIRQARIDTLGIGRITLSNVPVMIADDGATTPSIILGDDLLNLFPGYAIDFPRAELQIKLPPQR
ncbi:MULTISPECIES: aspartyl protease family protein [unclassified Sphingomonas]|jgi:predicted aspartyl protease|uniref:aspartyl protease family protein n=1 Tax=unclassified Sphingomonas TaxID=196159 RepID=UPI000E10A6EC|nr:MULTISPECIES: aspartyl protease family protein [unclassified Sphingomonas]AXJ94916.1 hypothetical protein DM480_04760 [Sphingomonas sp. FARSPH]